VSCHIRALARSSRRPGPHQAERVGGAPNEEAPLAVNRRAGLHCSRMGLGRVELPTSRLSGVRSNHLSYRPAHALR
jgi:hypothetical protein